MYPVDPADLQLNAPVTSSPQKGEIVSATELAFAKRLQEQQLDDMMNKTQVRAASLVLQEGDTHATLCFYKDSSKNEKIMTVQSKRTNNSDAQN